MILESIQSPFPGMKAWEAKLQLITVMQSVDECWTPEELIFQFGTDLLPLGKFKHTSISHAFRYPTWDEIKEIKEQLHGDVFVFQALPPKAKYVNAHPYCFHLWEPLR